MSLFLFTIYAAICYSIYKWRRDRKQAREEQKLWAERQWIEHKRLVMLREAQTPTNAAPNPPTQQIQEAVESQHLKNPNWKGQAAMIGVKVLLGVLGHRHHNNHKYRNDV